MIQLSIWTAALLTSLFSAVLQVLWHYLPAVGLQRLQAPATYIIGVLTALVPASACALAANADAAVTLAIVWLAFLVSGGTVVGCYAVDAIHAGRIARQEADLLRRKLDGQTD